MIVTERRGQQDQAIAIHGRVSTIEELCSLTVPRGRLCRS